MISVVTVVRNGVSTIEETIKSVIGQDYSPVEYIIIDGESTDGTLEILEKYADKVAKVVSEPDLGIYDAMNKGISLATGQWIYFLGADDVFHANSTLSQIFQGSSYADYNVVYGNVLFKHTNRIFDGRFDYDKHALLSICQQAIFYRSSVFKDFGLFDLRFKTAADYIFNMSLFCRDIDKWKFVDVLVADYNEYGASASSRDKNYKNENFALRYDNFRPYASRFVLSRIFYSSFIDFFVSHRLSLSLRYFKLVITDIGVLNLINHFFLLVKIKFSKKQD